MGTFIEEHGDALLVGFVALLIICRQSLQKRYLKELIRREKESGFARINKIVAIVSTAFARGPTPTLADLAKDIAGSFTIK